MVFKIQPSPLEKHTFQTIWAMQTGLKDLFNGVWAQDTTA